MISGLGLGDSGQLGLGGFAELASILSLFKNIVLLVSNIHMFIFAYIDRIRIRSVFLFQGL